MDAAGYKVGELLTLSSISRHTCIQGENISSHGKFSRKYGTQIWMFLLFPGWHYISQLHYIRVCLYNPRYIMYITLLSFGVWRRLFEGGYYYAHLGAACGGYMSAVTIWGAARIRGNMVYTVQFTMNFATFQFNLADV